MTQTAPVAGLVPVVKVRDSLERAAYALPVVLLTVMVLIYVVSPTFYLTYVLEKEHRETQAVEILTFLCGLTASGLLVWSAWRLWRLEWQAGKIAGLPGGPMLVAVVALATIFFTGEEISWGQTYLQWQTPEAYHELADSGETNLHNAKTPIRMQSLGSLFLIVAFLGLPLAWRFRDRLKLPADWHSGVAEGPVVFTILCGFLWARSREFYLRLNTPEDVAQSELYAQFISQMKEQKELLFAVGFLMYGLYRVRRVREHRATSTVNP
ncbi:MAG: hypothetical protein WD534_08770 [Phycisphaeraceae bacterium]